MEFPMHLVFSYQQCLNFFEYLDDLITFCVDDVIIYSKTEQDYLTHLQKILEKFCYAGLKLKPSKYDFFKLHIEYCGHLISGAGIYLLKQKVPSNSRLSLFI